MSSYPTLIEFWKIRRKMQGLPCEVKPFHHDIADALTNLVLGRAKKPNLMILEPPRCCKTDLGIRTFIPWSHSYFPDSESIITSYGQELAVDSSIDIRSTFASEWYRSMISSKWGAEIEMRGENAGGKQDHFYTTKGGSVKAVGRGGGITGFGAGKLRPVFGGILGIDDLLKANEANSAAARKDAYQYISQTLKSRRNRLDTPSTPMVLIMQRLHPEDPAGMLLREEKDEWEVLQIQAHNDKDEVIWPGRLSMKFLDDLRETDPDTYWAQYMQEPSQSHRAIFQKGYWQYWRNIDEVEKRITLKIITADTAFEEKASADFSVFQCWGFEGTSGMYLLDQIRGQWEFPDLMKNAKEFIAKHATDRPGITPATEAWIENKASGISLVQSMRREGLMVQPWTPKEKTAKDKVGRAKQCTMPLASHRIFIPDYTVLGLQYKWVEKFINEHSAFTDDDSHLHDDQVDTFTEACSIWQERGGAIGPLPVW